MRSKVFKGLLIAALVLLFVGSASANYYFYDKKNFYEKQNKEKKEQIERLEKEVETLKTKSSSSADEDMAGDAEDEGEEAGQAADATDPNAPVLDTSGWETYTNSKYGYSFKLPPSYEVGVCDTKPDCGNLIIEQDEGDSTTVQGDISETGWPMITISHYDTEFYNPDDVMLRDWLLAQRDWYEPHLPEAPNHLLPSNGGGYPAIKFTYPSTPQSYAIQYVYFTDSEGRMFEISMLDPTSEDAANFYDAFLYHFMAG